MATTSKKVLTFDDIKAADDLGLYDIEVPEWGGVIRVRPLSIGEVNAIVANKPKDLDVYKDILTRSAVEPRLTGEQVEYIWTKSAKAGRAIIAGIDRANGWAEEAKAKASAEFQGAAEQGVPVSTGAEAG